MTRSNLKNLLDTLQVQNFYDHTTSKDVVNLPFIIYLDNGYGSTYADNQNYYDNSNFTILIHSAQRNETLEQQLEALLIDNHIPYEKQQVSWDNDLLMWIAQYEI